MHDWKIVVRNRLRALRLEATAEANLSEELSDHLEDFYRELRSGGSSDADAYQKAVAELDDVYALRTGLVRSQVMPKYDAVPAGDVKPANFLEDLWRDLRYACRTMRKSPLFVAFVVVTLALGIGANTTVFTVINTLILNPVRVQNPAELISVQMKQTASTSNAAAPLLVSYANLKDLQARNGVFTALAGYSTPKLLTLQEGAVSQRMFAELVTGEYFSTLGLTPARGRFFLPEEDGTPGAHPVVVINYGTWQAYFGGRSDIIGKKLLLNHIAFTVVGVAPPQFIGLNAIFGPDVWIPSAMSEQLLPTELRRAFSDRGKEVFEGVGRLKPGVTLQQARSNLSVIATDLAREYPVANAAHTTLLRPIREVILSNSSGSSMPVIVGSVLLLVVVGIVLLIACSNVANLLLARSAARQQEMSVRLAMGASRPRLLRQLLTESVLLGLLSGALGLFVGYEGMQVLMSSLPGTANFVSPKFDGLVFGYGLLISLATGFVFGAIPAFKSTRTSVAEALKEESRTTGRSQRKITLANALLVGQVAFSFALLMTAALFLRSIGRAYDLDPGFQTRHLATFIVNPGQAGYAKPQTREFYRVVRERVERIPDVASVSWSSNMPLWGRAISGLLVEGRQQRSQADRITTIVNTVDRNYFETMGVMIGQGREFSRIDQEDSIPVAIVNEKLAHDYWPRGSALGKRIQLPGEKQQRQIVGIARTANYTDWGEPPQPCVYLPLEQNYSDSMALYVRSKEAPQRVIGPVEREIRAAYPQILVGFSRTGREIVEGGLFQVRMGVLLLSVFGLLALALASIGLYGILAYSVTLRRREIGVRLALGAARENVMKLILKQGMSLVLAGVLIGFVASLAVGTLLSRMLYGIGASDPASVAGAACVMIIVAFLACYLPARKASRVDPLVALREG